MLFKIISYSESFFNKINIILIKISLYRFRRYGIKINFVEQGPGRVVIAGDISRFKFHETSHLKSNTFIECTGGVDIGEYFHPGRGLTIFSTNHNYKSTEMIPYDSVDIISPVLVGDFVWCGSNVSIAPGSRIGDGVVIGMGTVVSGVIPPYSIICGNPCKVIGVRDAKIFEKLRLEGKYN
jgi:acetyltransferase-like isoleucine patch superfamily enzyme